MGSNRYYRRYIEKMINDNPTVITITRIEKVDDGFGGVIEEEVTIQETVTFYNRRSVREIVDESGKGFALSSVSSEKLLALADTSIREGDIFNHAGREYRVSFLQDYRGICKQAELQVIG